MKKKKPSRKNEYLTNTISTDNYGKGWNLLKANFWPFIAIIVIATAIELLVQAIGEIQFVGGLVTLVAGILLTGPISMGVNWAFLKASRKEKFKVEDMFAVFQRNYWNAVAAGLLSILFVIIGLILFIIPGIYIAVKLAFVSYLVVDKKMKAMDAIKKSWEMTKGHGWTIFLMGLIAIPLVIIGLILFLLPVFIAFAWIAASFAVLYNSVSSKK